MRGRWDRERWRDEQRREWAGRTRIAPEPYDRADLPRERTHDADRERREREYHAAAARHPEDYPIYRGPRSDDARGWYEPQTEPDREFGPWPRDAVRTRYPDPPSDAWRRSDYQEGIGLRGYPLPEDADAPMREHSGRNLRDRLRFEREQRSRDRDSRNRR